MNQDQIKGSIKDAVGKLQEKTGEAVGNDRQQIKGQQKQGEGKVDKIIGDVKDIFKQ